MGMREQFQVAVVVGEGLIERSLMHSSLSRVARTVTEAANAIEAGQLAHASPVLFVASIEDPDLESVWSRHVALPGSCGSVLMTTGPTEPLSIARLAAVGPTLHLPAPFDVERFDRILSQNFGRHTTLVTLAQLIVGQGSMIVATRILRDGMFLEAMRRTFGNRMAAAELLQIDRREVQRMAKRLLPSSVVATAPSSHPQINLQK
jgi:hypothetical protein